MVEVGYRFTELYFAGKEHNWDYAKYQAEKIEVALRLGLERRPKRAQSAQFFWRMRYRQSSRRLKARIMRSSRKEWIACVRLA